jgi:hypothetical protein
MKTASHEVAAELIGRLRRQPSDKSDVALVRELEGSCIQDIILNLAFIALFSYGNTSDDPFLPLWALLLLVALSGWNLVRGFRNLIRARAVRALFENQGPQNLADFGKPPPSVH